MGPVQADLESHIARETDLLIEWNVPGRRGADDVNAAILRDLDLESMPGQHISVQAQL
jgi:hypothetical protein